MGGKSSSSASTSHNIEDNRIAATDLATAIRAGGNVQVVDSKTALAAIDAASKAQVAAAQKQASVAKAALAAQKAATQEVAAVANTALGFGSDTLEEAFNFAGETQESLFEFLVGKDNKTIDLVADIVDSSQENTQAALNKLIEAERSQDVETFQMLLKLLAGVAVVYFVARIWGK